MKGQYAFYRKGKDLRVDPPKASIHNLTVKGGWGGKPKIAVDFEITADLSGDPGAEIPFIRSDDPLFKQALVTRIVSLDPEYMNDEGYDYYNRDKDDWAVDLSPQQGLPVPDNTPMNVADMPQHGSRNFNQVPLFPGGSPAGKGEDAFGEYDSSDTTPGGKKPYTRGSLSPGTLRRLFPRSLEDESAGPSGTFGDLATIESEREMLHGHAVLGDLTNTPTKQGASALREASNASSYLDIPAIEQDEKGICHVPFPQREPSAETVAIDLSSNAASPNDSDISTDSRMGMTVQPRIFSPDFESEDLTVSKRVYRSFAPGTENTALNIDVSPPTSRMDMAEAKDAESTASPTRFPLKNVPARCSSKIPVRSPNKNPLPEPKPSWRYPAKEEIVATSRKSLSPTREQSPEKPSSAFRVTKGKHVSPDHSPKKPKTPTTPRMQKLDSKSLDDLNLAGGKDSPERPFDEKKVTMTVGRAERSKLCQERDRDITVKVNRPSSPSKSTYTTTWSDDENDTAVLGTSKGRAAQEIFFVPSLGPGLHNAEFSDDVEFGESASLWKHKRIPEFIPTQTNNADSAMPSPSLSSQMVFPWTSTTNALRDGLYSGFGSLPYVQWNEILPHAKPAPIYPQIEEVDGVIVIKFPDDYNTGMCRITFSVEIYAGDRKFKGWHPIAVPGLPTDMAERGSFEIELWKQDGWSSAGFKHQGLSEVNIEEEDFQWRLSGYFDNREPLDIEVQLKETTRVLEDFDLDVDIQGRYQLEKDGGLSVDYTATCYLCNFDEDFAAHFVRFGVDIINSPPGEMDAGEMDAGEMDESLMPSNGDVSFNGDGLTQVGGPFENLTIPFRCLADIIPDSPFTLSWKRYLGLPPIDVNMPKVVKSSVAEFDKEVDEWGLPKRGKHPPAYKNIAIYRKGDDDVFFILAKDDKPSDDLEVEWANREAKSEWPPGVPSNWEDAPYTDPPENGWNDVPDPNETWDDVPPPKQGWDVVPDDKDYQWDTTIVYKGPDDGWDTWATDGGPMGLMDALNILGPWGTHPDRGAGDGWDTWEAGDDDPDLNTERWDTRDDWQDAYNQPLLTDIYDEARLTVQLALQEPLRSPVILAQGQYRIFARMVGAVHVNMERFFSQAIIDQPGLGWIIGVFRAFVRCCFLVVMFKSATFAINKAEAVMLDEWRGRTNYLWQGVHIARSAVGWVEERSSSFVRMGREGEGVVKTVVEGILPDDGIFHIDSEHRSDAVGGDDVDAVGQTKETMEELGGEAAETVLEKAKWQPGTDSTVRDYVDYWLGWQGPREEQH